MDPPPSSSVIAAQLAVGGALAQRAQTQATPRASAGTTSNDRGEIVTSKHQHRVAAGSAAIAQRLASPHSGQRLGSTVSRCSLMAAAP